MTSGDPPAASDDLPNKVGRYRAESLLGRGGMGDVLLARDTRLDRPVAVKVLRATAKDRAAAPFGRFRRECGLLLDHPHEALVPLLDADLDADPPYLVMRFMAGGDLAGRIPRGPAAPGDVLRVGRRLAAALEFLHGRGVLHRDVKPENVLFDDVGEAYLGDLGLGKSLESTRVTNTGYVVGTPAYMAPELLRGGEDSPASDLYGVGATLASYATGTRLAPFQTGDVLHEILARELPPSPLRALLMRCTLEDPAVRLASARELRDRLAEISGEEVPVATSPDATRTAEVPLARSPSPTRSLADEIPATPPARTPSRVAVRRGSARGLAAILGVLALAAAVGSLRSREATRRVPVPEAPAAPAPALAPRLRALRESAADLAAVRADEDGRVVPEGPDAPPWTLADGDPATWPEVRARVPELGALVHEVARRVSRGTLDVADRAEALRTDRAFRDQALPPPFEPWLEVAPAPGPVEIDPYIRLRFGEDRPGEELPRALAGFAGAGLADVATAHHSVTTKEIAIYGAKDVAPASVQGAAVMLGMGSQSFAQVVALTSGVRDARVDLTRWLRPDDRALRRGLAALVLAIEAGERDVPGALAGAWVLLPRILRHLPVAGALYPDPVDVARRAEVPGPLRLLAVMVSRNLVRQAKDVAWLRDDDIRARVHRLEQDAALLRIAPLGSELLERTRELVLDDVARTSRMLREKLVATRRLLATEP